MGKKMASAWLDYKRAEWHAYSVHVTDWEKQRYLKMI
jgi:glutamine synthetase